MTHQQTKERLIEEFYAFVKTLPSRVGETPEIVLADFISRAIDEAAHATENAAEVEPSTHPWRCKTAHCHQTIKAQAFNAAITQSRRKLDEYFGRNV